MATQSVLLLGESQGRGSLAGCRLWGRTESDTTEATQQQQQQQQQQQHTLSGVLMYVGGSFKTHIYRRQYPFRV